MADDIIPASPTSVKLITKRKSRKNGFNKRNRFAITEPYSTKHKEISTSMSINPNSTSSTAEETATTTTIENKSDHIDLILPQDKNKFNINVLYDEHDDVVQQSLTTRGFGIEDSNCHADNNEADIFACAKLLEFANKKAITPKKSKSKPFNNLIGKFVSLNEHFNHKNHNPMTIVDENIDPNPSDLCAIIRTPQVGETNIQIGQLYKDSLSVKCDTDNLITAADDTSPTVSLKRSIKDIILCDFNVNSPSPIRSQKEPCLLPLHDNDDIELVLNLKKSTTLKTYSKIREEKCINRKLFGHTFSAPSSPTLPLALSPPNSPRSSINHEWLLNDFSDNDCSENECCNTSQKRIITTSPALDLNKSQNLIENIQNLSSYYESQSTKKIKNKKSYESEISSFAKTHIANCDCHDDNDDDLKDYNNVDENVTLKTNFETILSKSITSDDEEDEVDDSDGDKEMKSKIIQITESNIYKTILDEDSDLFRQFISPGKIKNETASNPKSIEPKPILNLGCVGNGFTTGRGIQIKTTSNNLKKSINFFNEDLDLPKKLTESPPLPLLPISNNVSNNSFSNGRGKTIAISANALEKSTKIFEEESLNSKQFPIANKCLGKSSKLFDDILENKNIKIISESLLKPTVPSNNPQIGLGFSTGRGNEIKMSKNSKQMAEKMFNECLIDPIRQSVDINVPIGFSTGRGNQVNMSKNAKQLAEKMFNECSNEIFSSNKNGQFRFSSGRQQQPNRINISKDAQKRAKNLFNNDDSEDDMQPKMKIPSIHCSKLMIENKHKEFAHKLFQDYLDNDFRNLKTLKTPPPPPCPIISSNFSWNDHPHKQNQSPNEQDLKTPINNNRRSFAFSITQEITDSTKALLEDEEESCRKTLCRPIRLSSRFSMTEDDADDADENNSTIKPKSINPMISEIVRLARHLAREEQLNAIIENIKKTIQPRPGCLYLKKLISTKKKWNELVSNKKPINKNIEHAITSENIDNFYFNMADYLPEKFCMENTTGIHLSDGIVVHMNNENQISFTELENGFLSCPFIDQTLLHKKWCRHHLELIILKLAAMENAFPQIFPTKSILNLENVMLQLKYRYDREIDNAEQSTLRKIIEFNNASTSAMILYVHQLRWGKFHDDSDFSFGESNLRMELSDGWYKITAQIDESLEKMVKCGKIKNGTKLIVNGAEILGLNKGCSPFEVPSSVRLKIHGNSTRRCRWDTKLGFYKHQNPLKISLNSILPNGGLIGRLVVSILRKSPVMYIEKLSNSTDNSKIIISERVFRRKEKQQDHQSNLLETIEKLYSQVTKEYEATEENYKNEYSKLLKKQKQSEIIDPDELYLLYKNSNDPETFELELTNLQRNQLNEYQIKKNQEKNDEIQRRVREKLNNRNSGIDKSAINQQQLLTKFIKLRIIDLKQPKKSAILTIWNPNDELLELLYEKQIIEITNVSAVGIRFGDLQLSAGKRTNYKSLELPADQNSQKIIQNLYRKVIQINEIHKLFPNFRPQFNEFDTVGIVVSIGPKSIVKKNFQPIYIVDKDKKMLCVNFWDGIDSLGYEQLIKIGNLLAIKNLQWRTMSSTEQLPKSFASEYSIFSTLVKQENHCDNKDENTFYHKFIELQNFIKTINLTLFIDDCQAILENILSVSTTSLSSGLSTPNNLTKINTLKNFNSPHTPPTRNIMSPALFASTPITRKYSSNNQIVRNATLVSTNNNNSFSHSLSPSTSASVQSRIDRLNAYGQPPPISPIVFSKHHNFLFNRRIINKTKVDKNSTV